MTKTLFSFLTLFSFIILFSACNKDDDPIIDENPPVESTNIEITTSIDGVNNITFDFDECNYDDTDAQRSTNGIGTSTANGVVRNNKTLLTRIYNRDDNNEITEELSLGVKFSRNADEGEIDEAYMKAILDSELGTYSSENFAFDFNIKRNDLHYSNNINDIDSLGIRNFTYRPDFQYNITEYEVGYQSDCIDDSTVKLKGGFEGTFYAYHLGELTDSLYLDVPEFEVVLLVD